ncbi:MAG: hypothetical protein JXR05_06980 [Flavobacteriaceae bacterium]
MKKILYVLICFVFVQCENSQKTIKESNVLSDCLSKEDIVNIDKGVSIFEKLLKDYYKVEGAVDVSTYKKYLSDFSSMKLPRNFFVSKEAVNYLKQIKKVPTFNSIYKLYEEPEYDEVEIPITERVGDKGGEKEELPDFYVFDMKGKLASCIQQKSKDKSLKDYLQTSEKVPDISPAVKAFAMVEVLGNVEKDMDIAILSITFELFYESIQMFNKF